MLNRPPTPTSNLSARRTRRSDASHCCAIAALYKGPTAHENRSYWCQYAIDWVTIKATWDLTLTQGEHDVLAQMLNICTQHPQLSVSRRS